MSAAVEESGPNGEQPGSPVLVCVASSAGGVVALPKILDALPSDLPLAMIVVQHLAPDHESRLPEILSWHTRMQVRAATQGDRIEEGIIYVAPSSSHLVVTERDTLELIHTELVHNVRPAADLLFISAAERYPGPLIGIVLTGRGHDGGEGIRAIHRAGGTIIVQDPESAAYRSMPATAIATGDVSMILQLEDIASAIVGIVESRGCP